ncbi:MAG: hypothetical protein ACOCWZ_05085 [Spirochaetota bacterium]
MKKYYTVMILIAVFLFAGGCGNDATDKIDEFPTPQTRQEFQQLLGKLGVKLYRGTEIQGFNAGVISSLYTVVPRKSGTPKDIAAYYKKELDKALSPVDKWRKKVDTPLYVLYMNDETRHQFAVSVSNTPARGGYSTILKIDKNPVAEEPAGEVPVYEEEDVEKPY